MSDSSQSTRWQPIESAPKNGDNILDAVSVGPLFGDEIGIRWRPLPIGASKRWVGSVLVAEHIRNCVAFLGQKNDRGDFVPHGTGFFVAMTAYDRVFPYLVTAKHVLDDIPGENVLLRVNTISSGMARYFQIPKSKWHFHPDHCEERGRRYRYIDVAASRIDFNYLDIDIVFFGTEDLLTEEVREKYEVGTGDEVAIVGLFATHFGHSKNLPIVRIGNIAAMPSEPVPTDHGLADAYLVEVRSIGGISGSPVFTHLAVRPESTVLPALPYPKMERKLLAKAEHAHFLVGIVQGYYTMKSQEDWIFKTHHETGDLNTGITVVVRASKITETINQNELLGKDIEMAMAIDDESKRESGAKSATLPSTSSARSAD